MKVLIIDDEDDVRKVVNLGLFHIGGMDVIEASNGPDGIARARSEQPDVILLDMIMPQMDGAATLTALQSSPDTAKVPVIFLTAGVMSSEVQRLTKLGARGVIVKPFNPITLAERVRQILDTQ